MNKQTKIIGGAFAGVAAIAVAILTINNTPTVQHGVHYHKVTKGGDGGVFITSAAAGDTFALSANDNPFSYVYIGGVHGNATDSITLINQDGQVYLSKGITIQNSNFICINGAGVDGIKYGFKCTNGVQVPGVIKGLSSYINWHNCEFTNYGTGAGIFWDKEEMVDAEQEKNPLAFVYPAGLYHHNIYNNYFHGSGGDLYLGSTGFGNPGAKGRDPFHYNGTITYPKPMRMGDIDFHDNIVDSLGRSFQISGCDTLGAHVWNNTFTHLGYEYNTSQGAVAFGGGDKNIEFDHNKVDYTFINFYSYANGKVSVHDNSFDHADLFDNNGGKNINPEQNASCLVNGQNQPTLLQWYNNTIDYSNNGVQLVIYSSLLPGSCVSGVKKIVNQSGQSLNACSITDSTIVDTTKKDTTAENFTWQINVKDSVVTHDTTYVVKTTTTHDSLFLDSVKVYSTKQTTYIGIMPSSIANNYGVRVTRDAYRLEYFNDVLKTNNLIKRFSSYDTLLLNINHYNGEFTNDPAKHADSVKYIADKVKWVYLVIENEEFQPDYHNSASIKDYCAQLIADAKLYPGKVANGGFTMPLYQWYYSQTHDADFAAKCLPNNGKSIDMTRVSDQQFELDAIKANGIVANIHFYLSDTVQIPCIIRMIKYTQNYLGPDIIWISNEAGIYNADPALVKGIITIAKAVSLRYVILYSGNGVYKAKAISATDFKSIY